MLKRIIENNLMVYGIGTVGSLLYLVAAYQDLSDFISRQAVVGYNLVFFILAFGLFLNEFKPKAEGREEEVYVSLDTQNSSQEYPKFVDNLYNPNAKNEWETEEEELRIEGEIENKSNEIDKTKKENEELKLKVKELQKRIREIKKSQLNTKKEEENKAEIQEEESIENALEEEFQKVIQEEELPDNIT